VCLGAGVLAIPAIGELRGTLAAGALMLTAALVSERHHLRTFVHALLEGQVEPEAAVREQEAADRGRKADTPAA
jgi:hypothetical protein